MPVEQPSDQLGSLLQVLLLDGIHPDIGEVGFNAIKHPRQRHIERKKRMIEIGRVQFGFVALTTFYGCPAPTGNNIAYLIAVCELFHINHHWSERGTYAVPTDYVVRT